MIFKHIKGFYLDYCLIYYLGKPLKAVVEYGHSVLKYGTLQ